MVAGLLTTPVLSTAGGQTAELQAKKERTASDVLNELVVILFFTVGPVLGALIFLAWLGGLLWGILASLL